VDVLGYLIPASLFLGGLGLVGFLWTLRHDQYDDPDGDSRRILTDDYDEAPKTDAPEQDGPDDDKAEDRPL